MSTGIDAEQVESVFKETDRFDWAVVEFRGTYTYGEHAIVQEYVAERGTEFLEGTIRYYAGDELLRERANWWPVDTATATVVDSGEPIEEFCRERWTLDPAEAFEYTGQRDR